MDLATDLVAIEAGDPADIGVGKGFGAGLGAPPDHTDHPGLEPVPSRVRIPVRHCPVRPDDDLRSLAKVVRGRQPGMDVGDSVQYMPGPLSLRSMYPNSDSMLARILATVRSRRWQSRDATGASISPC